MEPRDASKTAADMLRKAEERRTSWADPDSRPVDFQEQTQAVGRIFTAIRDEMARQDEKWGIQSHSPATWLPILAEEVGEAAEEVVNSVFGPVFNAEAYRRELIQVLAVGTQMILSLGRTGITLDEDVNYTDRMEILVALVGVGKKSKQWLKENLHVE